MGLLRHPAWAWFCYAMNVILILLTHNGQTMKVTTKQLSIILLLSVAGLMIARADQTDELLEVMNQAMLEPCNIKPYLACLGLKQDFCRTQVGISVDLCHKKYPVKQAKGDNKQLFESFGICMQTEIITRLKLSNVMLEKCEPVLKTNSPKG